MVEAPAKDAPPATDERGRFIPPDDWFNAGTPTLGDLLAEALRSLPPKDKP